MGKLKRGITGCSSCKCRKKKCDESKPKCGACIRLQLPCKYEKKFYWYPYHQKSTKIPKVDILNLEKNTFYMINYSEFDFQLSNSLNTRGDLFFSDSISFENCHNSQFEIINNIASDENLENNLFDYYVKVTSKKKAFSDPEMNEFRSLIIPYSIFSTTLFQSIVSLAAGELSRKYPEKFKFYSSLMTKYKNKAINDLYAVLDEPSFVKDKSSFKKTEFIFTILILCSLNISDKGNMKWIVHLQEASMVFSTLPEMTILNSDLLMFANRYFVLRYMLLLTTFNRLEFDKFVSSYPWPALREFFKSDKVDYIFGCSPHLLNCIHKISILKNKELNNNDKEYHEEILWLKDEIEKLEQNLTHTDKDSLKLYLCSQAYYISTKIYFYNSFKSFFEKKDGNDSKEKFQNIIKSLVLEVLGKLSEMLHHAEMMNLFPTWCLLISSVYAEDEDKHHILSIFEDLEKIWPLGSPSSIKCAVETIWKFTYLQHNFPNNWNIEWEDILSTAMFKLALS